MVNNVHTSSPDAMSLGDSAVVIGASIAGLVSARILANYFRNVTVIERDALAEGSLPRKGVPQGRHGHGLLGRGQQIISNHFPGIFEELQQQGASPVDLAYDTGWYQGGHWRLRVPTGITVSIQSRPFLEDALRKRLLAVSNVQIMSDCDVEGFTMNQARSAITGVTVQQRGSAGGNGTAVISADFVVDAGGRGSRTSRWLEDMGYPKVEENQVRMNVGYTSRFYRRTPDPSRPWKALIIIPTPPDRRMGLLLPAEGDRWIASLVGWSGDHAPTDDAGFLEFARTLSQPTIYEALKDAEPLSPLVTHKIPSNLWRRYERMSRFPERLAVLGDALCSFNPTYAQGMTTSTLYADALDGCLKDAAVRGGNLDGLSDRFRKRAAKLVADPWLLATSEDFRYAETEGTKPAVLPLLHWYLNRVFEAQGSDPVVVRQFLQVMHMMKSPSTLFMPHVAARVLTARMRQKKEGVTMQGVPHAEVASAQR